MLLVSVGLITYGTSHINFTNANAALSQPTNWQIGYYNVSDGGSYRDWLLVKNGISYYQDPAYNRTGSSPNYNYESGLGGTGWDHGDFPNVIPNGMTINMTFNSANFGFWSPTGTGLYYPNASNIGSDNNVGDVLNKFYLEIDNQTNKDYYLLLDLSSTSDSNTNYKLSINNKSISTRSNDLYYLFDNSFLSSFYISAYSNLTIFRPLSSADMKFDAWYLQDLGVSAGYTQGVDDGYDTGYDDGVDYGYGVGYDQGFYDGKADADPAIYLEGYNDGYGEAFSNPPFATLMETTFNGVAAIFGISILGGITLGTLALFPLLGIVLLFFKKVIQ